MTLALLISLVAAVVPTAVYATIFYWADRYEREPLWLLGAAFVWGAVPAIIVSIVGELILGAQFIAAPGSMSAALLESTIIVPVVEETVKALALFAIYRWAYNELDNVLDGLIYGAMIGFGFAMTENFLYFISAYRTGGYVNLTLVIFMRAVLFGLNHAVYTSFTGIGLGLARTAQRRSTRRAYVVAGLLAAIITHGLHNFGATLAVISLPNIFFSIGLAAVGLGLLVLAIGLTWQQEQHCLRTELADEVGQTLRAEEYALLLKNHYRPLRRRSRLQRRRLQLSAELAFRKFRLRTLGVEGEPDMPAQIERIRTELAEYA